MAIAGGRGMSVGWGGRGGGRGGGGGGGREGERAEWGRKVGKGGGAKEKSLELYTEEEFEKATKDAGNEGL